jgi:hypothetical protein
MFPACDGAHLRRGETQCVFTEDTAARLGERSGVARCVRHGHIICDYIEADTITGARKKAKQLALNSK